MKVLQKESFDINMPKKIIIGDPVYFEQEVGLKFVYSKQFRGRDSWVGKLVVKEEVDDGFQMVNFFVAFAPNKDMLETYLEGKYYKGQKVATTEIGVDTARYLMEIDDNYIEVGTGSDGYMGVVIEFNKGSKLEGITIDLTGLDVNEFERFKDELKYVFNA